LCPIAAIRAFLAYRGSLYGPLFIFDNGDYLTRRYLAAFLKLVLTVSVLGELLLHSRLGYQMLLLRLWVGGPAIVTRNILESLTKQ